LASHFFALFGPRASPLRAAAQRAFAGSLAGYSLAAHFLSVRDRHNGNLLLVGGGGGPAAAALAPSSSCSSSSARLVHIDLGFMLTNAPGGLRFEGPKEAPFKLTRELLEVLDTDAETGAALLPEDGGGAAPGGSVSPALGGFRAALVRGFLAARRGGTARRLERLIRGAAGQQVGAVAASSSPSAAQQRLAAAFPCFSVGGVEAAVAGVRERLALANDDDGAAAAAEDADALAAVVKHVLELLAESMDAFASRQYDLYQRVVNGIL
jgi:phosphatidylinositol 4-kinase